MLLRFRGDVNSLMRNMLERAKEFALRGGERTWAKLRVEPNGKKMLCHKLTETELAVCPPLVPYEGAERLKCVLAVRDRGPCVELVSKSEQLRVRLAEDTEGRLFEVVDPLGDAQLMVALQGPGSIANERVQEGWLALKLRRVKSDPQVMMGKPVIRGTRITVELILRKLAGGASEDDVLRDYPQLTREDLREALVFAADVLRGKRPYRLSSDTTSKS
jgi:uncharacterized protein (DUF433 family)